MEQVGFLYVLANSAMPGVVKVGKTTRSPAERASELSGPTGLPTPFIVVYEQLFEDCSAAESFVHVYLEQQGYRVADNREFFNAPTNLVVKAISLAPGAIDGNTMTAQPSSEPDELLLNRNEGEHDELSDLTLEPAASPTQPWEAVFEEAENYYYGHGDHLQDAAEAMRLFRRAAQLGSLCAYARIGQMYEAGEGVRKDSSRALDFYKEGARKGDAYCYWRMGQLFVLEDNPSNADKCFSLFLKNQSSLYDHQPLTHSMDAIRYIDTECAYMLIRKRLPSILNSFIVGRINPIRDEVKKFLNDEFFFSLGDFTQRAQDAIKYLDNIEAGNHDAVY